MDSNKYRLDQQYSLGQQFVWFGGRIVWGKNNLRKVEKVWQNVIFVAFMTELVMDALFCSHNIYEVH